jgi:hypothetical protein
VSVAREQRPIGLWRRRPEVNRYASRLGLPLSLALTTRQANDCEGSNVYAMKTEAVEGRPSSLPEMDEPVKVALQCRLCAVRALPQARCRCNLPPGWIRAVGKTWTLYPREKRIVIRPFLPTTTPRVKW